MARWDDILTLPVQNPPTLDFSAADLVWSNVDGWKQEVDRVARIPFSRVEDFVRGESSKPECPTRFHVEARRKRPKDAILKPRVDAYLEYILYWCSFGPDDYRKGGVSRPSRRNFVQHKKKTVGRPNTKRGCVCHFIVKKLVDDPSVALIIYNKRRHVDVKGLPCHGPLDVKAIGTRAMFAPDFSEDLRLRIVSLLHVGVPVESIMQRHSEMVEKQGGPRNRDDLLTHRHVRTLERNVRRSTFKFDVNDTVSLGMWVQCHQNCVFFYEDFSDAGPFVLGLQSEWQLQQMIQFSNRSLIAYSSRFGTNKLKYAVHSLLVFNKEKVLIPIAWIVTTRFVTINSYKWIRALYNRVHAKDQMWKLAGFIIDDPTIDIPTIKEVFQCSILVSFWRVRHAWHKNLIKKCSETETQVEIFKRLGQTIYRLCGKHGCDESFQEFLEDFIDSTGFLEYFTSTWLPRIGTWVEALKSFPFSSQEACAAMENYHYKLKVRLLNEKQPNVYQRADWLADKLATKVHSYFWLDEYAGRNDFIRYKKLEWESGLTSWQEALLFPDSAIVLEDGCAKVIGQSDQEGVHVVRNPGSEYALCDCDWSRMGNLCKHVIKVAKVCRHLVAMAPSISLSCYKHTLNNVLYGPPHDSLIMDHAVSLAVNVRIQLNAMDYQTRGKVRPTNQETDIQAQAVGSVNDVIDTAEGDSAVEDRQLLTQKENAGNDNFKTGNEGGDGNTR
ncbi:unnamed protein product [Victoria cruziana]